MHYRRCLTTAATLVRRRLQPSFSHVIQHENDDTTSNPPAFGQSQSLTGYIQRRGFRNVTTGSSSSLAQPLGLGFSFQRYMSSTIGDGADKIAEIGYVTEVIGEDPVGAVASQVPAVSEVATAAADSAFPIAFLQYMIDGVHNLTGLNWWASIALTTVLIRTATVPVLINRLKATSKLLILTSCLEQLIEEIKSSGMDSDAMAKCQQKMQQLFKEHGVTLFTPLKGILIQGSISISFFLAIRNMTEKVPSFKTGGAFWFIDLTTPDSLLILPILTALSFWITVECNRLEGLEGDPVVGTVKKFSRILAIIGVPVMMGFPNVINCIWSHPDAPMVYLACDLLGQEEILTEVSEVFGCKIYVDKMANPEYLKALTLIDPNVVSQDPCSRFHLFGAFPRLYERAKEKLVEARVGSQPEPLIISSSAQWYACQEVYSEDETPKKLKINEPVRDEFGVWHACYSIHSSKDELEWALKLLAPKRIVSTTPHCRAMELGYVKKYCFATKIASDDPLWKLLDISAESHLEGNANVRAEGRDTTVEGLIQNCTEPPSQTVSLSSPKKALFNFSPPSKGPSVTLFGRARLGLGSSLQEETKETSSDCAMPQIVPSKTAPGSSLQLKENVSDKCKKLDVAAANVKCELSVGKQTSSARITHSFIGSSKSYSENLRKFYRTMNVPVPQPLPSLVELMRSKKRVKRAY